MRSLEIQLVRVETCGCAEGFAKECENPDIHLDTIYKFKICFSNGDTEHSNRRWRCAVKHRDSNLYDIPKTVYLSHTVGT